MRGRDELENDVVLLERDRVGSSADGMTGDEGTEAKKNVSASTAACSAAWRRAAATESSSAIVRSSDDSSAASSAASSWLAANVGV